MGGDSPVKPKAVMSQQAGILNSESRQKMFRELFFGRDGLRFKKRVHYARWYRKERLKMSNLISYQPLIIDSYDYD